VNIVNMVINIMPEKIYRAFMDVDAIVLPDPEIDDTEITVPTGTWIDSQKIVEYFDLKKKDHISFKMVHLAPILEK